MQLGFWVFAMFLRFEDSKRPKIGFLRSSNISFQARVLDFHGRGDKNLQIDIIQ